MQRFKLPSITNTAIRRFLAAPVFSDDEDKTRLAYRLNAISLVGIFIALIYPLVWLAVQPELVERLVLVGAFLTVFSIVLGLIRLGHVTSASHFFLLSSWLLVTFVTFISGGTRAPFFGFYVLVIMSAIIFSDWRAALLFGILTFFTGFIMVHLANIGQIRDPLASPASAWLTQATIIVFIVLDAYVIMRDINRSLQRLSLALAEREKTEATLRESEERYRRVSELTSDYAYSYRVDPDRTYHLEWLTEDSFYRITGIQRQDFGNATFSGYHPGDEPLAQQDIEQVLDGQAIQRDYRLVDQKTGEIRWVHIARYPVWDEDEKRVVRFFGAAQDITARKQAEIAREAHEQRYKGLFEQTNDAVFIINLDAIIETVNQRGSDMLGYTIDELVGQSVETVIAPSEHAHLATVLAALKAGQDLPVYERTFKKKTGDEFPTEVSVALVRDSDDKPFYIQSVVRDITERKKAEAALRESEERYRRVSELTSDYAYSYRVDPDRTYHLEWLTEDSFYRITGMRLKEFNNSISLYHPDDEALVQQDIQRVMDGHTIQHEYRILTKTGGMRWVHIARYPVWDETEGRVVRFYGAVKDITKRKQVEAALRQSEKRYRAISEMISDYAYAYDIHPDGTHTPAWITEDSFQRLTGYIWDETGATYKLYHPEDSELAQRHVEQTISGQPTGGNYRIITKSGETRWIHIHRHVEWDEHAQRPIRFYGAARDITERIKFQTAILDLNSALSSQTNQLETLNQIAQDISALTDLSTTLKRILATLQKVLPLSVFYVGLFDPAAEAVTFPLLYDNGQFWEQDPIPIEKSDWTQQVLQTGQPLLVNRTQEELESADTVHNRLGDLRQISASILMAPLSIGDQNIGVISVQSYTPNTYTAKHFDLLQGAGYQITIAVENARLYDSLRSELAERQRLETELQNYAIRLEHLVDERTNTLRQTKEQLELVLNSTTDALAFADASGDILVTNPAFRATFSERGAQAVELILWALADDAQRERLGDALLKVLYDNESQRVEAQIISDEGQEKDIDLTLIPVRTANDEARNGILVSGHDITQMKEIERFKEQFVADAVHDLATPIAGLSTRVYLLQRTPEKLIDHARALENQVQHLRNLLEDLRTLSRMDRGQLELNMALCSISEPIQRVFDTYEPVAIDKHQSLELCVPATLPRLKLDQAQIERVLVNLISNAINYTPAHKTIRVETAVEQQTVVIQVSDQGIGIAPEDLPYVFDRFYRAKAAREQVITGSGLGLAITKEIVALHGGSVSVRSELGHGSTFTIELPLPR